MTIRTVAVLAWAALACSSLSPAAAQDTGASDWSGFYAGIVVGARADNTDWTSTDWQYAIIAATSTADFDAAGLRVGGVAGFNYRIDDAVFGLEAELAWANNSASQVGIPGTYANVAMPFNDDDSLAVATGFDASLRGRVGLVIAPNAMIYATAGVSVQQFDSHLVCDGMGISVCAAGPYHEATDSRLMIGPTVGAGAEVQLAEGWRGRVEYRFADYGIAAATFPGIFDLEARSGLKTHTVSVGLLAGF